MQNIFILTLFLLAGCSTLNEDECRNANWFELGRKDAERGKREHLTKVYKKDCQEYGVSVSVQQYSLGFKKGLSVYCTSHQGYSLGEIGAQRHFRCEEVNHEFSRKYQLGLMQFKALEKQRAIEKTKQGIVNDFGGATCSFNHDCKKSDGACINKACNNSSKSCVFNSDCDTIGVCELVSRVTEFGDHVGANVCRY